MTDEIENTIQKFKDDNEDLTKRIKLESKRINNPLKNIIKHKRKIKFIAPLIRDLIEAKKALDYFNSKIANKNIVKNRLKAKKQKKPKTTTKSSDKTTNDLTEIMLDDDFFDKIDDLPELDEQHDDDNIEQHDLTNDDNIDENHIDIKKEPVHSVDKQQQQQVVIDIADDNISDEDDDINIDHIEDENEAVIVKENVDILLSTITTTLNNTRNCLMSQFNDYTELLDIAKRNLEVIESQNDKLLIIENSVLKQLRSVLNGNYKPDVPFIFSERDLHSNSLNMNPFLGSN